MTEERIKELVKEWLDDNLPESWEISEKALIAFICTVTAEARKEGIEEMLIEALNAYYDVDSPEDPDVLMKEKAERLKEKP